MAKSDYKGIWVFAEQQNGKLNGTVLELLAKSQELKEHTGEEISAVLLGKDVSHLADTLFAYGADKVILVENDALANYSARPYEAALTQVEFTTTSGITLTAAGETTLSRFRSEDAVRLEDLVPGTHVQPSGELHPNFTAFGTGMIQADELLRTILKYGFETVILEQDDMRNLSVQETLLASYLNMKETGFVI